MMRFDDDLLGDKSLNRAEFRLKNLEKLEMGEAMEQFRIKHGLTISQAEEVRKEFLKFLVLASMRGKKIGMPSDLVEELWNTALLDIRLFDKLYSVVGTKVHDYPHAGGVSADNRFRSHYVMAFKSSPPLEIWNKLEYPKPSSYRPKRVKNTRSHTDGFSHFSERRNRNNDSSTSDMLVMQTQSSIDDSDSYSYSISSDSSSCDGGGGGE
jgi:hypothetical protein